MAPSHKTRKKDKDERLFYIVFTIVILLGIASVIFAIFHR